MRRATVTALLGAALALPPAPASAGWCGTFHVTGYNVNAPGMSAWTADGTSSRTAEPIAAAHGSIPFGSVVTFPDLGSYRVADRGRLGPSDVDIRVWSDAEAYALTDDYWGCVK